MRRLGYEPTWTARTRDVGAMGLGLFAVAIVTMLLRLTGGLSPTTAALALLLVVLAIATIGRLWTAIVVAVVAVLALNFFFIPPLGTFTIAEPEHWTALLAFLVVAIIGSNLSTTAQGRAREAIARREELTRLFELTRDVLLTAETAGAIDSLARHIARRFELSKVAIALPGHGGWQVHQGGQDDLRLDPTLLDRALATARGTDDHVEDGDSVSIIPLRHGTTAVGLLAAEAPALEAGSLNALAGVVAIAIERAQFLAERDTAELVRQKADLAATLLASLSHDLKTPLTAIRVALENLGDELSREERDGQSRLAISEVDRLTHLFQDILDMARIDAAVVPLERQWVSPADVVDAALVHARHALDGRQVHVDADADHAVHVDPRLSSVALSHLLENAAKYSPADRSITVLARGEGDALRVSVTDHGPGLDPRELDQLFERFYRGRAAAHGSPGTGMGLAIARGLLAAGQGRVWAENVAEGGARFSMVMPGSVRDVAIAE